MSKRERRDTASLVFHRTFVEEKFFEFENTSRHYRGNSDTVRRDIQMCADGSLFLENTCLAFCIGGRNSADCWRKFAVRRVGAKRGKSDAH